MRTLLTLLLLALPATGHAEVVSASATGFEVRHTVDLAIKPETAFAAFAKVGGWWNAEHSYSGDSKNLSLDLKPGGCFCERIPPGGGIEHMRVSFVDPGKRLVLTGALGPLLFEATAGVMDVQVKPTAGGSAVTLNYRAAGFARGGADKLAPLVDKVLGDQMSRYAAFARAQ